MGYTVCCSSFLVCRLGVRPAACPVAQLVARHYAAGSLRCLQLIFSLHLHSRKPGIVQAERKVPFCEITPACHVDFLRCVCKPSAWR